MAKKASSAKPSAETAPTRKQARPRAGSAAALEAPPPPSPVSIPAPIPLDDLVGQDRALRTLLAALDSGRIHHAWIFHGPAGVGKFTAALAFAALLLDPTSQRGLDGRMAPDPDSPTQRLLAAGTHPDLHVIVKELARVSRKPEVRDRKLTNIPAEVVREFFVEPAALTARSEPGARASKVFIVDEAELLDPIGQNTILKVLEEPAAGAVLILVTSAEESLLATIRSRCQRVAFGPVDDRKLGMWAERTLGAYASEDVTWAVSFADGSPGRAMAALRDGLAGWYQRLGPMLETATQGRYSDELGPAMAELVDKRAAAFVEAHANASKEAANRAGADDMFRLVAWHLSRALRRTGAVEAGGIDPESAARAFDAVRDAERRLDANVNLVFVFEGLSADLTAVFSRR